MSNGKWDFYLTSDAEKDYLHFQLKNYQLDTEKFEEPLPHEETIVRFIYEVKPERLSQKPENGVQLITLWRI